MQYRTM